MKNSLKIDPCSQGRRGEQVKTLSPRQYLSLSQAEKERIGHARVVAPKLGDALAFGKIELTYK
jgi:hypothetical protein